jgi:hypothetical protein
MNAKRLLYTAIATCHAVAIALSIGATTEAAVITDLRNTGLDGAGNYIAAHGAADGNYFLLSAPAAYPTVTVDDTVWPIAPNGPWVINSAGSRWIGPDINGNGIGGAYVYRTTFTVPANAILNTVNVSGLWSVDDFGTDIVINGNSTGQTKLGFTTLAPFSVTSGFVFGLNTLDFHVANAFPGQLNPTGLRVDRVVGTYQIPEPSTLCIVCVALLSAVLMPRGARSQMQPL